MTTVVIGVGATKAGTSWLHAQLARHADCHFRSLKELHYFKLTTPDKMAKERAVRAEQQARQSRRLHALRASDTDLEALRQRERVLSDRSDYLRLLDKGHISFEGYLAYLNGGQGAENAKIVGECTPAYCLLPEEMLRRMAGLSDDVRFIYVIRDPLARLWSNVRMMAGRREPDGTVTAERSHRILRRTLRGEEPPMAARADYAAILTRLKTAIPPDQLMTPVFEDIFTDAGFRKICRFLDLAPITPLSAKVHPGTPIQMKKGARKAALEWLAPQYDAVDRHFGGLPEGWVRE